MLRLNRMTDYGIVVLGQMAQDVGRVRTAAALAEASGVPVPTVSKLLKQMTAASLITARRGAKGGYALDRPAAEVTVTEIIQALEGPIALTACVEGSDEQCNVARLCPIRGGWEKVNGAIRQALEAVSLSDLVHGGYDFVEPPVEAHIQAPGQV